MTLSIRERLLEAITTAVGGVYAEPDPVDERDLPFTLVVDQDETASLSYDTITHQMPISIVRITAATVEHSGAALRTQANEQLAALMVAMHNAGDFSGLAVSAVYTGGGIAVEAGQNVFAQADYLITYNTVRGDPYNKP